MTSSRPASLHRALRELDTWRAQYKGVPEFETLLLELERLDRHVKLMDAVEYAKLLETEGHPRPEAALRAAAMFHQKREEVLAVLRAQ